MALAPELSKGIAIIDHEFSDIEKSLNVLMQHADQNGEAAMKDFIFAIRSFSKSQSVMTAAFVRAIKRTSVGEKDIITRENKVKHIIEAIKGRMKFSSKELADQLESSFDAFTEQLAFDVRFHTSHKSQFNVGLMFSRRVKLLLELKKAFDMPEFHQLVDDGSINKLRDITNKLATVRYNDLQRYIDSMDGIIGDFNRRYSNIYAATQELSFIKGVDLEPKKTFFGFAIKKETKPMPLGLTPEDLRRIKIIQGWVHELHELGMKLIRAKQREILAEIEQIKQEEAELRVTIKRSFHRDEQRLQLKMAA